MSDEKPIVVVNMPGHRDTCKDYKDFKEELNGCIMCACDHGCNQWIVRNSAKALALMEELEKKGVTPKLDEMAKKSAADFGRELFDKRFSEMRKRRKEKKNAD